MMVAVDFPDRIRLWFTHRYLELVIGIIIVEETGTSTPFRLIPSLRMVSCVEYERYSSFLYKDNIE